MKLIQEHFIKLTRGRLNKHIFELFDKSLFEMTTHVRSYIC